LPRQDTSRPDRKVKRRKIVCEETKQTFDDVFAMSDELNRTIPHCYNIIKHHLPVNGLHYQYAESEVNTND